MITFVNPAANFKTREVCWCPFSKILNSCQSYLKLSKSLKQPAPLLIFTEKHFMFLEGKRDLLFINYSKAIPKLSRRLNHLTLRRHSRRVFCVWMKNRFKAYNTLCTIFCFQFVTCAYNKLHYIERRETDIRSVIIWEKN